MFHAAPKYDRPSPEGASSSAITPPDTIDKVPDDTEQSGIICIAKTDIKSPLISREWGDIAISDEIAAAHTKRMDVAITSGDYSADLERAYQSHYRALFSAICRELEIIGPGLPRAQLCDLAMRMGEDGCLSGSAEFSAVSEKWLTKTSYNLNFLHAADRQKIALHFLAIDATRNEGNPSQ